MLVESQPKVFYFTDHYRDYPMVLIRLSKAKRAIVEPLLRRHWRTLASKKAVKEFDESSHPSLRACVEVGKGAACAVHRTCDNDGGQRCALPTLCDTHEPDQFLTAALRNPANEIIAEELFGWRCRMRGSSRDAWCRRCGTC